MSKILLANEEKGTSDILTKLLKTEGYKVVSTSVLSHAQESIETEEFDLLILSTSKDFDPDLSLLKSANSFRAGVPIIVINEPGDSETNVLVADYNPFAAIEKPLKVNRLLTTVQKAVDFDDTVLNEKVNLNLQLEKKYQFPGIVAESPAMKSVCDMVSRVAGIDVTILLCGEAGTGKQEIAQAIHANSNRKDNPLVSVDCSAGDPEIELFGTSSEQGAFEKAAAGTIYIINVEKLSAQTQEKLANVLSSKSLEAVGKSGVNLNLRVLASVSSDPDTMVAEGRFSEALYKILKVILIKIQPLKNRPQDIMPTVRQVLQAKIGDGKPLPFMDASVIEILEKHPWPNNLHDIEDVMDHCLKNLVDNCIQKESLPKDFA